VKNREHRRGIAALEVVFLYPFIISFFVMMLGVAHAFIYKTGTIGGGRYKLWVQRKNPTGNEAPMNLFKLNDGGKTQEFLVHFNGGIFDSETFTARTKVAVLLGTTWDYRSLPLGDKPPLVPHAEIATKMVGANFPGISGNSINGLSGMIP
jgi:hypothetical protein